MYETRPSAGKGLGTFTSRIIQEGACIMTEEAILSLTKKEHKARNAVWFVSLKGKFNQLSQQGQATYLALSYRPDVVDEAIVPTLKDFLTEDEGIKDAEVLQVELELLRKIMAIYLSNRTSMGDHGELGFGIFPKFSRINHSCVPNATFVFNPETERVDVYALKEIKSDEEITVAYFDIVAPSSERRETLESFGFTCTCAACEGPEQEIRDSRRQRLSEMLRILKAYMYGDDTVANLPRDDAEAAAQAYSYVSLLQEEDVGGEQLALGYDFCGYFQLKKGDIDTAIMYDNIAMENRRACRGRREADNVGDLD
ncbi:SET domain-containing protein [Hypoxylon sp. FL0543]|nr:SET domain-containing protein [Hypoxylon sp. FL0543]